jgi:hypothetical protein
MNAMEKCIRKAVLDAKDKIDEVAEKSPQQQLR